MGRPIILVDLDGVLVDFDGWIFDRSDMFPSLNCTYASRDHYFLTDNVNEEDAAKMRKLVNESRIFLEADPLPGAIEGLNALRDEAEVWLCTRPLEANLTCRDDKARWVREHFDAGLEKRLILTSDKSLVHGDLLLDDHIKIPELERATWRGVCYEQPFNQWQGGAGTWDHLPRFQWGDDIENLLCLVDDNVWG